MKKVIAFSIAFMPFLASAQLTQGVQDVSSGFKFINSLLTAITTLIFAAAFVYVLYGVFEFVRAADDAGRKEGRQRIIWGIVGLAVMVSVYGLVGFVTGSLKLQNTQTITPPAIPALP